MTKGKIINTLIVLIMFCLCGCEQIAPNNTSAQPRDCLVANFNNMPRPVIVVTCNEGGLAVLDGNGDLHAWNKESYYMVTVFAKADLKKGEILMPVRKEIQCEK